MNTSVENPVVRVPHSVSPELTVPENVIMCSLAPDSPHLVCKLASYIGTEK
jgi:hypothetical protein